MTLKEMRESNKVFLTCKDVSEVLEADPNTIRA